VYPVVGVAGLPCAGKSEVARMLGALGACVIDVDAIGHELLAHDDVRQDIRTRFPAAATAAGTVDRQALGRIVFADDQALEDLEAMLHPRMRAEVERGIAAQRHERPVVIDAALLVPMGLADLCQRLVLVEAPLPVRQQRAAARGWSAETLARRDRRQAASLEILRARADLIVQNDGAREALERTLVRFWKEQALCLK